MQEFLTGLNTTPGRMNEYNQIQSDADEKISRLFTKEISDEYRQYKKFENEWVILSQIIKELEFRGVRLEKDRAEKLVEAMYNDRQEMMTKQMRELSQGSVPATQSQEEKMKKSLEIQKEISGKYLDSATKILTEPQLKIFKRYFDNQIYNIEKSLIEISH